MPADTILYNAKVATNGVPSFVEAVAITDGKITAIGSDREIFKLRGPLTSLFNAIGRTVIPGLNDSHMHPIRAGLSYNMELRWDGVPSLADALRMLKEQAARTPAPQWVRVIGGSAGGQNSSLQSGGCQPWKKSISLRPTRPSLCFTCMTVLC